MAEHPHRRAIAAGVAALLAGLAVALIVAGGDDDRPPGTTPTTERTETAATETETTTDAAPGRTETRGATETAGQAPPPPRQVSAIQRTVVLLAESAELNDAEGVCRALGQPTVGTSPNGAQECARRAGIDLAALPGSDELSFERTTVEGGRASVLLSTGDTVELRRANGRWVVTGLSS